MSDNAEQFKCKYFKIGWFVILIINFMFGLFGVIICSLKLSYEDETIRNGFFKLSMAFAACNLILSVLLLVAVLKNKHECAFLYAFLSFLSLFAATIHIESSTSKNISFLIIFIIFGMLCLSWFCVYGAYQVLLRENLENKDHKAVSPV